MALEPKAEWQAILERLTILDEHESFRTQVGLSVLRIFL
jgi:hypothetical protein